MEPSSKDPGITGCDSAPATLHGSEQAPGVLNGHHVQLVEQEGLLSPFAVEMLADSGIKDLTERLLPLITPSKVSDDEVIPPHEGNVAVSQIITQIRIVRLLEEILRKKKKKLSSFQEESGPKKKLTKEIDKVGRLIESEKSKIKTSKKELSNLQQEIKIVEKCVKTTKSHMTASAKNVAKKTALVTPLIVFHVLNDALSGLGTIAQSVSSFAHGLTFVGQVFGYRRAKREKKEYCQFDQVMSKLTVKEKDLVKVIETQQKAQKALAIQTSLKTKTSSAVDERLKEKHKEFKACLRAKRDLLESIIEQLNSGENPQKVLDRLKRANLDISRFENLEAQAVVGILKNKEVLETLLVDAVRKDESTSVMLRNGLVSYASHKAKIDRQFLNFRFRKAKLSLTISGVIAAVGIAAKVFAMAMGVGIIAALSGTGYGLIGIGVGMALIGAIYFSIKKPNLFKVYLKGIPIKMRIKKISLCIQRFRLAKTSAKLEKIRLAILQDRHKNFDELDKLDKKRTRLDKSITKMTAELSDLQKMVTEAGWKDFQKSLNSKAGSVTPSVIGQISSPISTGQRGASGDEIFAEFLLQSHQEDENADRIWQMMGIDLKSLKQQGHEDEVREEIARSIRSFFSANEGEMLALLKQAKVVTSQ